MAEREGFEPPDPCESVVFKTTALNRSATSPEADGILALEEETVYGVKVVDRAVVNMSVKFNLVFEIVKSSGKYRYFEPKFTIVI